MIATAWLICSMMASPLPERYVDALALVESGGDPRAVGRHGELTQFQVLPRVWAEHSRKPLSRCAPAEVRSGIVSIWGRRVRDFEARHGRRPSLSEAYLLWHRPARVLRPSPVEAERAVRFGRLVEVHP